MSAEKRIIVDTLLKEKGGSSQIIISANTKDVR